MSQFLNKKLILLKIFIHPIMFCALLINQQLKFVLIKSVIMKMLSCAINKVANVKMNTKTA